MPLPKHLLPGSSRGRTPSSASSGSRARCPVCNDLDPRGHNNTEYVDSTASKAARQGQGQAPGAVTLSLPLDVWRLARGAGKSNQCRFCAVLVQALSEFVLGWNVKDEQGQRKSIILEIGWKKPVRCIIGTQGSGQAETKNVVEIYTKSGKPAPWPSIGTAYPIRASPLDDEIFTFIDGCMKHCQKDHEPLCTVKRNEKGLPSRLLRISTDGQTVRVVTSQNIRNAKYVALSHCWGTALTITTTNETLAQRMKWFPVDELSSLFRDAVAIIHRMGIDYIWIDSLCILQDCQTDWALESSKMSEIYTQAYLTIAATSSACSTQSFLTPRRKPTRIVYRNTKGDDHSLIARIVASHHADRRTQQVATPCGPLTGRAWALQEHVLATRILHYTAHELIFECRGGVACECRPVMGKLHQGTASPPTTPGILSRVEAKATKSKAASLKISAAAIQLWHHLMESYTLRALSRGSDKLPALAGLARRFAPFFAPASSDTPAYVAGLWRDHLPRELLWHSAPDLRPHPHDVTVPAYRAPSWSFASVDAALQLAHDSEATLLDKSQLQPLLKVTKLHCLPASPHDAYGAVAPGAYMVVRGAVAPGVLVALEPRDYTFCYKLKIGDVLRGGKVDVFPDCKLVKDGAVDTVGAERANACAAPGEHGSSHETNAGFIVHADVRRANADEPYGFFKARVLCLGVMRNTGDDTVTGIVIGKARTAGSAPELSGEQWERLGLFQCGKEVFAAAEEQRELVLV